MTESEPDATKLRAVAATPISDELAQFIMMLEPRVDFIVDQTLLPPMRWPGDHAGDPSFARSLEAQCAFEELLDSGDVLYGIPGEKPVALRRAVSMNPKLRWVQTMSAGGGGQIKAAQLTEEQLTRVAFTTSAGVHAQPLAEYAIFGLLAGAKGLPRLVSQQNRREWSGRWPMAMVGDQRILLVGLGNIGRAIAAKLKIFGATVVGVSRRDGSIENVDELVHPANLREAAAAVDGIVVSLPGTRATKGLLGADVFSVVRPGTTIVSVGRGTVIDEAALLEALDAGRIGFAALDVFADEPLSPDSPLWAHPQVLISPHTAALTTAEDRLIAELFAQNASRLLERIPLVNTVDTVEFY